MFIEALFTIAKTWKQPKELFPNSSLMDEGIKNVRCIYMLECCIYSTKRPKNNTILAICDNLDDLEGMMVIKQVRQRQILYDFTYMCNLKVITNKTKPTDNRMVVARGEGAWASGEVGEGAQEVQTSSYKISKSQGCNL